MSTLNGKVAVITGASKGIGRSIAVALGKEGCIVSLCARSKAGLEETAGKVADVGGKSLVMECDISRDRDIERTVTHTLDQLGKIDILVNNAGVGFLKPFDQLGIDEFDTMWKVNIRGAFLMTKAVLPNMKQRREGCIVNIASLAGKNGFKGGTGYGATKWALRGFATSLMLEVREANVKVVTIFPGSVDTSFSKRDQPRHGIPKPEDVAAAVLFAVASPERALFSEIDLRPTHPPG
jgi:NADP-dependent 3-hydroxy acid dehydrogenase YdfG